MGLVGTQGRVPTFHDPRHTFATYSIAETIDAVMSRRPETRPKPPTPPHPADGGKVISFPGTGAGAGRGRHRSWPASDSIPAPAAYSDARAIWTSNPALRGLMCDPPSHHRAQGSGWRSDEVRVSTHGQRVATPARGNEPARWPFVKTNTYPLYYWHDEA